jgi:hypothetical protein
MIGTGTSRYAQMALLAGFTNFVVAEAFPAGS